MPLLLLLRVDQEVEDEVRDTLKENKDEYLEAVAVDESYW